MSTNTRGSDAMKITTTGLDLAKNVLQVHGVDGRGKKVVNKPLKRSQVLPYFANLPPCLIGMEACAGAHHWARKLQTLGHTVRLISPQFVKPYVKSNKNDRADAEAICEAVGRPNMRFVAIKTVEQQAILAVHRARQGMVKARTAQANQIRGLLAEFGLILPKGISHLKGLPALLEDAANGLPGTMRQLLARLGEHLQQLEQQVAALEEEIQRWHRDSAPSRKVAEIPGIGPLSASAFIATLGEVTNFANGRQAAACLGLVPKQASTGGKPTLLGISKRGDSYLRTLLIHGARAVVAQAKRQPQRADPWLRQMLSRRPTNVVAVALANKNTRTAWALLAHGGDYQSDYTRERAAA
jgi:transposase